MPYYWFLYIPMISQILWRYHYFFITTTATNPNLFVVIFSYSLKQLLWLVLFVLKYLSNYLQSLSITTIPQIFSKSIPFNLHFFYFVCLFSLIIPFLYFNLGFFFLLNVQINASLIILHHTRANTYSLFYYDFHSLIRSWFLF